MSHRADCRCGAPLVIPAGAEKVVCGNCGARVRVRRPRARPETESPVPEQPSETPNAPPVIRFSCPCGKKLRVPAENPPEFGTCPACGRLVLVPEIPHDAPTGELAPSERRALDNWIETHRQRRIARAEQARSDPRSPAAAPFVDDDIAPAPPPQGLRVCPACRQPVHVAATRCRSCGAGLPA